MSESGIVDPQQRPRRVAPFAVLAVTVLIAGFFWILVGAPSGKSESADSPLIGKPAPSVRTTTLDGQPFDLGRRRGSWVYLNFFQTTCVGCVQEHPELVQFTQDQVGLGTAGAEFYSVIWSDSPGPVQKFFKEKGGDWPLLLDENGDTAVAFNVAQVPETWLVDPDGIVVARIVGATSNDQLSGILLREQQKALNES
jgi:cytochrome c biogenesis protein CcmG, thiol:disulfide interchange protein DsbE